LSAHLSTDFTMVIHDYYDNGKIKLQVTFENNNKTGIEKEYDNTGKLTKETTWENII